VPGSKLVSSLNVFLKFSVERAEFFLKISAKLKRSEEVLASEIFFYRYLLKDKRSFLLQVLHLLPLFFPFVVHASM